MSENDFQKIKKVAVAMSGGVDSSVAAYLLKEQKYEVIGVSMHLFPDIPTRHFCADVDDARYVADRLNIPLYVVNFTEEFKKEVIDYFCHEYVCGRTPNPCIKCNEKIKFDLLFKYIESLGIHFFSTGHYAKIQKGDNLYLLKKAKDIKKDQSYLLFQLTQEKLKRILFPLGDYTKQEVREIAFSLNLRVHNKPASQEICFIDNSYAEFIKKNCSSMIIPGVAVDENNNIIGEHKGLIYFTIGQRCKYRFFNSIKPRPKPYYVIKIIKKENKIVIGDWENTFSKRLIAENVNWIIPLQNERLKAKIRYAHEPADCLIRLIDNDKVEVIFDQPQFSITPGQAVVFYENDIVVGGGIISESENSNLNML